MQCIHHLSILVVVICMPPSLTRSAETPPPAKTRAGMRKSKAPRPLPDSFVSDSALILLPTECLVEVLQFLEVHELLEVAWTCRRMRHAAQDSALWSYTRFSTAPWYADEKLSRHFEADITRRHRDHTGMWTRCTSRLTQVTGAYPARG